MKGVVFTELIEFVENNFSFDTADKMLEKSILSTNGVYTQAGNYPFDDLFSLFNNLSKITKINLSNLIESYGIHLFSKLVQIYDKPIKTYTNSFDLIENVEHVIHPEVKKLYPDSDLPTFIDIKRDNEILELTYISDKPLMDFAKGLILGCARHYKENLDVNYILDKNSKYTAKFTIKRSIHE